MSVATAPHVCTFVCQCESAFWLIKGASFSPPRQGLETKTTACRSRPGSEHARQVPICKKKHNALGQESVCNNIISKRTHMIKAACALRTRAPLCCAGWLLHYNIMYLAGGRTDDRTDGGRAECGAVRA